VRFRATDGTWRNNVDVTHVLGRFPLSQFSLHQSADGALTLRTRGAETEIGAMVEALRALLGSSLSVKCEPLAPDADGRKPRQYTSDLPNAPVPACPSLTPSRSPPSG
jgi:phenylacetate-CoA ligase